MNSVEAKQWPDKSYGDSAPGKSTIIDWYAEFKRGRTNTDDAKRSGRPKSAVVPENITKREIADTLKISEGSFFTILHESLGMRKLFSKWVSRLLTPNRYTPGTKRSSDEWTAARESRPNRPKTQQWAGKVNSDYYMALLDRLSAESKKKRPDIQKKKVLFHQDNAPCHKSMKTMVKLNKLSFKLLPHPPYSPDLSPGSLLT